MITERDEIKCRTSLEMIDQSELEPKVKADLKESIEEAKANLNGRTLEERVLSIAQNQFDTTRFLADIIIQFKNATRGKPEREKRTWKDVLVETQWASMALGTVIAVCSIFQPQIIALLTALTRLL